MHRILAETAPLQSELNEALRGACTSGCIEAVRNLLARNADVNARDEVLRHFPLLAAVCGGNVENVRLLLAAGADPTLKIKCQDRSGNWKVQSGTIVDEARKEQQEEIAKVLEQAMG